MAYDQDNIFARILRGEIPCEIVYEDDHIVEGSQGSKLTFNAGKGVKNVKRSA